MESKSILGDTIQSRRSFIQQSAVAGLLLTGPLPRSIQSDKWTTPTKPILTKGYAARDKTGKLSPWSFERRAVGDNDVLIDIKFCGVCHSDIHTVRQDWGAVKYPLVPGHEIAGVVAAVGKNVTTFKVGDQAGVGCMVDSCGTCESCKQGEENYCDNHATVLTYASSDKSSPSGITQGGYANNIVVQENFVIKIPSSIDLQHAAPLLCAGITTYSPLMRASLKKGARVGVAGIGGLGHMAIKLAKAQGAEVYAFTTSAEKVKDILGFGAKEAIVVDSVEKLKPYNGTLDFMISTIPATYDIAAYTSLVKPFGNYIQVGVGSNDLEFGPKTFIRNRVNFSGSSIGGIPQTQEVMDFCARHKIYPAIQLIKGEDINKAYEQVIAKEARYRYVIDTGTI